MEERFKDSKSLLCKGANELCHHKCSSKVQANRWQSLEVLIMRSGLLQSVANRIQRSGGAQPHGMRRWDSTTVSVRRHSTQRQNFQLLKGKLEFYLILSLVSALNNYWGSFELFTTQNVAINWWSEEGERRWDSSLCEKSFLGLWKILFYRVFFADLLHSNTFGIIESLFVWW